MKVNCWYGRWWASHHSIQFHELITFDRICEKLELVGLLLALLFSWYVDASWVWSIVFNALLFFFLKGNNSLFLWMILLLLLGSILGFASFFQHICYESHGLCFVWNVLNVDTHAMPYIFFLSNIFSWQSIEQVSINITNSIAYWAEFLLITLPIQRWVCDDCNWHSIMKQWNRLEFTLSLARKESVQ